MHKHSTSFTVPRLSHLCAQCIARNIDKLIIENDDDDSKAIWHLRNKVFPLPSSSSDQILEEISKSGSLKASHLALFSKEYVNLQSLYLRNVDCSSKHLQCFRDFTLYTIKLEEAKGNLNDFIQGLSRNTLRLLHTLTVTNMNIPQCPALGSFENLRVLNLSRTDFSDYNLEQLVISCPRLMSLDLSYSKVTNISPLRNLKTTLIKLAINRLQACYEIQILKELENLQYIDVSNIVRLLQSINKDRMYELFDPGVLPRLKYIDVSGWKEVIDIQQIRKFVQNHPNLEFLGLCSWFSRYGDSIDKLAKDFPDLAVLGVTKGRGMLNMLKYCYEGEYDLHKFAPYLERHANAFIECRVELLEYILGQLLKGRSGERDEDSVDIIIALLTKVQNADEIPSDLLNQLLIKCKHLLCDEEIMEEYASELFECLINIDGFNFDFLDWWKFAFEKQKCTTDKGIKVEFLRVLQLLLEKISADDLRKLNTNRDNMRYLVRNVVEQYCPIRTRYYLRRNLIERKIDEDCIWYFKSAVRIQVDDDDDDIDMIELLSTFIGNSKYAAENFIRVKGDRVFRYIQWYLSKDRESQDICRNMEGFLKSIFAKTGSN